MHVSNFKIPLMILGDKESTSPDQYVSLLSQLKTKDYVLLERINSRIGPFELAKTSIPNNNAVEWDAINSLNDLLASISPVDFQDHNNLIHKHKMIKTSTIEMEKVRSCGTSRITPFCLAAVETISNVSASGLTPYFFMRWGSENSLNGIKANKNHIFFN